MAYDGGEISIWRCTDSDNLRFDWYGNTLRNRHASNIAVTANSHENGADIRQATFDNSDIQKWR
ncbi:hypothetical protein [Kistimonas asteriae]|uniref:hypothetical protein n=1 Tax=Kistimonas asteriae TaxID=517724 RepID=UPI003CCE953A